MSMRIQNDGIGSTGASQTAPVDSFVQQHGTRQTGSAGSSAVDHVEISSLSGNVASASAALANQQAARVSQLAALYAKGDFHVDSTQLSRTLISGSLAGGAVESDGGGGAN